MTGRFQIHDELSETGSYYKKTYEFFFNCYHVRLKVWDNGDGSGEKVVVTEYELYTIGQGKKPLRGWREPEHVAITDALEDLRRALLAVVPQS